LDYISSLPSACVNPTHLLVASSVEEKSKPFFFNFPKPNSREVTLSYQLGRGSHFLWFQNKMLWIEREVVNISQNGTVEIITVSTAGTDIQVSRYFTL
jgi:hypothetical protein